MEILLDEIPNLNTKPILAEIEITEACNLRCQFCYCTQDPKVSRKVFKILERLHKEGVSRIALIGGEPTVHPDIVNIARHAVNLFGQVFLVTNGTRLRPVLVKGLAGAGLWLVAVSIHGNESVHDMLTQRIGSHTKSLQGAREVLLDGRMKLLVNTTLTAANVDSLFEHLDELYSNGIRTFTFTRFSPAGIGALSPHLQLSRAKFIEALYVIHNFALAHPGEISASVSNGIPPCGLPKELKHFGGGCIFGCINFYVDVEGNLLPCGMLRLPLGNIFEESIAEIKRRSSIVKKISLGAAMPEQCKTCIDFLKCHGGCRAAAYASTQDICGADPYCIFH